MFKPSSRLAFFGVCRPPTLAGFEPRPSRPFRTSAIAYALRRDPHIILGVSKGAGAEAVKKAWHIVCMTVYCNLQLSSAAESETTSS
jgi:hypothetical protein